MGVDGDGDHGRFGGPPDGQLPPPGTDPFGHGDQLDDDDEFDDGTTTSDDDEDSQSESLEPGSNA